LFGNLEFHCSFVFKKRFEGSRDEDVYKLTLI